MEEVFTLPTEFNITDIVTDGLGLMYYDPVSESLKEIDESSSYVPCTAYDYVIRRFYLCGDLLYSQNNIKITVNTSEPLLYTSKVIVGGHVSKYTNFNSAIHEVSFNTSILAGMYTNAIPIDILIESTSVTEKVAQLIIGINSTVPEQTDTFSITFSWSDVDAGTYYQFQAGHVETVLNILVDDITTENKLAIKTNIENYLVGSVVTVTDNVQNDLYHQTITIVNNTTSSMTGGFQSNWTGTPHAIIWQPMADQTPNGEYVSFLI